MPTSVTTAWLPPTFVQTPAWNGNATTWANASAALLNDGNEASTPLSNATTSVRGLSVWLTDSGSSADTAQISIGSNKIATGSFTSYDGSAITYSQVSSKLRLSPWASSGVSAGYNYSQLYIRGFDVSEIPADSIIEKVEWRVYYSLSSTEFRVNYGEVRITYSAAPQAIEVAPVDSAEGFEAPSFSPGITYVNLDGASSAEVVASPQLNLVIYPSSASSAEVVTDPLMTLFAATLGGIPSAETVSALGATAMVLAVDSILNSQVFGDPQMNMTLPVSSIASAEAFGDLTTKLVFSLDGIASAESVSNVSFTTQFINGAGAIPSDEAFGTILHTMFLSAFGNIAGEAAVEAPTITQSPPPPPPATDWSALGKEDEKVYLYKVYDAAGGYIGVWSDVKDTPQWTQHINTPGTTTTVFLSRSPNTTKEQRANLLTEAGEPITTEDGQRLVTVYETPNSVGQDTDVDINYRVDIYVHYGQFDRLVTQDGEPITTEDGEYLLVASGAPLGVRVFSGYIMDYESIYGDEAGVSVTLASHGHELSQEIVRTGETTTVAYNSNAIDATLKAVLDTNPGVMTYDSASIVAPGVTATLKFQLNTKLEAIDSIYNQTPDGWYWYGHVGENLVYMRPVSSVYDHTFVLGKHIKSLRVRRSIESIKNVVYFVGGETTPGNVATTKFKKYTDASSITNWRRGIERITDRRYTVDASMQRRAEKVLNNYSEPIFTSPLIITAAKYDIESIKLGQTVGFAGFGNFIDDLPPLQIVSYSYSATQVALEIGQVQERQVDTLSKVESTLNNEAVADIPTAPS